MNTPANLKYTESHEWVEFTGDTTAKIGLTDHAQDALGDLVFVNLPEAGDALTAGEALGDVESVKAVSDVNSPVTGTVSAANDAVADDPSLVNSDPYGSWLVEVENITDREELLDAADYQKFCEEEG